MKNLISILLIAIPLGLFAQWNNIEVNQVAVTATYDSIDLTGKQCQWWTMTKFPHVRISPITTKVMPDNELETSWLGYYNSQTIEMVKSGDVKPWLQYAICAVCVGTDTLEVYMDSVGAHDTIQITSSGNWMNIDPIWMMSTDSTYHAQVFCIDSIIWDPALRYATNIQNTVWSGLPYNHSWFNNGWAYAYPNRRYRIIMATSEGGFMNYWIWDTVTGDTYKHEDELTFPVTDYMELGKGKIISRRRK